MKTILVLGDWRIELWAQYPPRIGGIVTFDEYTPGFGFGVRECNGEWLVKKIAHIMKGGLGHGWVRVVEMVKVAEYGTRMFPEEYTLNPNP